MKQFILNCLYNKIPSKLNTKSVDGSHSRSPTRDYEQIHDPIYNAQRASPRTEITQSFEPSKGFGSGKVGFMTRWLVDVMRAVNADLRVNLSYEHHRDMYHGGGY